MSIQDVSAEELARLFHHYQGALARDFESRKHEQLPTWDHTPQSERKMLVAAARLTLLELADEATKKSSSTRPYFAKPGEADWGC